MIGLLLPLLMNNLLGAPSVVTIVAVCLDGTTDNPAVAGVSNNPTTTGTTNSPTFTGRVIACT